MTRADFRLMLGQIAAQGYETITTPDYARAMRGDVGSLPDHPILITFDDGRLDSYTLADPILLDANMRATMFVITSRQDSSATGFMSWAQVQQAHASGRWDIQLHAASGHTQIPIGVVDGSVVSSAFFANRRFDPTMYADASDHLESHTAWKARVEQDVVDGVNALGQHLDGHRPVAFAVPYSDFGQLKSNDASIASELRTLYDANFAVWFTQDDPAASPTATRERGRYYIRRTTKTSDVMLWLSSTYSRYEK